MGACDTGRCCKGSLCDNSKKCCCTAANGTFTAGEVCRTAACTNGGACDYMSVCECDASGGTLTQSCDPCLSISCNKCERCEAGVCVSICTQCQRCDPTYGNGTCVPKCNDITCGQCQYCNCGACVTTGVACGSTCCTFSQCCVGGTCVSCDCTGQVRPGPCYACQSGVYVNQCTTAQKCCNGTCAACCVDSDCQTNYKCVSGNCEPKQCSDYENVWTYNCYAPFASDCGAVGKNGDWALNAPCPAGCVVDPTGYPALPAGGTGGVAACCQQAANGKCTGNLLP